MNVRRYRLWFPCLALISLAACSEPAGTSVEPIDQEAAREHELGRARPLELPLALAEFRKCDNSTSTYTTEGTGGVGLSASKGFRTLAAAADDAVKEAIEADLEGQFNCQDCPDGDPCAKSVTSIDTAGAHMEDPGHDCEYIEGAWHCFGNVSFGSGGGPKPSGQGGCKKCPKSRQAEVQVHGLSN